MVNGLVFDDGTTENEMTYTENGQILDGQYKMPSGTNVCWYTDTSYRNRVVVSNDGTLNTETTKILICMQKKRHLFCKMETILIH